MSRWNAESDLDYRDEPWIPRANAECSHCGAGFVKGREDTGSLCDACCRTRDAAIEALKALRCEQLKIRSVLLSKKVI